MALRGRDAQKLRNRCAFDGLGNGIVELTSQIGDGLCAHVVHPGAIRGIVGLKLLRDEKLSHLVVAGEVQTPQIDDGVAVQDQADGLKVSERELVECLEALAGRFRHVWRVRRTWPAAWGLRDLDGGYPEGWFTTDREARRRLPGPYSSGGPC